METPSQSAGGDHAGHAHETKFTCAGCGGAFASEQELSGHKTQAHSGPGAM